MGRGAADPKGCRHSIIINPGDTFGLWTALEEYIPKHGGAVLCRCEDGTERLVRAASLVNGESSSCGCGPYKARLREGPYLAAGATFNLLTALEDAAGCDDRIRFCCECGGEPTIKAVQVKLGLTKSCGHLARTHGFSGQPLHSTWHSMIQRCTNPNHASYHNYGGRRIPGPVAVCDRWLDPWLFAEDVYREIGPRPRGKDKNGRVLYEFDRVDNDLGYRPGNVRWADKKTQRANQRTVARLSAELAALRASLPPA